MVYPCYNFGIEIEAIVRPYARRPSFTDQDWYKQLAQRLENRNVPSAPDVHSRYSAHPEYYSAKWFITRDGSLHPANHEFVAMEIVSPILNTRDSVTKTLSEFWEAMSVGFEVQRAKSCGGHVHVTPTNSLKRFTLPELQKCAFAIVAAENLVHSILPASRRENTYCVVNSKSSGGWGQIAAAGISTTVLRMAQAQILGTRSLSSLHKYMQANRYVLWNFQNICVQRAGESCSGTIEFRGGNQFVNAKTTLKWIAFVVAFIHLALDEDLLNGTGSTYIPANDPGFNVHISTWWKKIRRSAANLKVMRHLPKTWKEMRI